MVTCAPGKAPTATSPGFNGLPAPIFEALHSGRCCGGEILVSPGIGPLDRAAPCNAGKLTSPIQDLPSVFRRECPDHTD